MQETLTQPTPPGGGAATRDAQVLICGGGITGLALATGLCAAGLEPVVLDRNAEPGGVIGTLRRDGFIFERGPNTVLAKYDSLEGLIERAGLTDATLRAPLREQTRHIWLRGALREVAMGPGFLASPLLPPGAKLALLREPFVAANAEDESVADFVRRRLGPDWLRNLITPMVSGIWAGDPELLSTEHAFPLMKQMEREGGSLLLGAVARMRDRKRARREGRTVDAAGRPFTRARKELVSFRDGLQQLPEALARRLGAAYHPSTAIDRIDCAGPGRPFHVHTRTRAAAAGPPAECVWRTRHLVVSAEADRAAEWLAGIDGELAAVLNGFPYNRLVVAALGLRADEARLPGGFGFLVPRGERVRILGAIVNSNFLPGRAPAGCAALTIFIGGDLDPGAFDLTDDEICGVLRRDLRRTVDWRGDPVSLHIERWPRAIPQYDMRHGARLRQIEAAERRWPGLELVGNWRGGTAVGDRIEYAHGLAARLAEKVRNTMDAT